MKKDASVAKKDFAAAGKEALNNVKITVETANSDEVMTKLEDVKKASE